MVVLATAGKRSTPIGHQRSRLGTALQWTALFNVGFAGTSAKLFRERH